MRWLVWCTTANLGWYDRGPSVQPYRNLSGVSDAIKHFARAHKNQKIPCDITALQFKNGSYRVWTANQSEPSKLLFDLKGLIAAGKLEEAQSGKRVKLTGARCKAIQVSEPSGIFVLPGQSAGLVSHSVTVEHQVAGGFCALHSVANAVALSRELYGLLYAKGPLCELEQIRAVINEWKGAPCQLHQVKVENTYLLSWLLQQTEGLFAIEFLCNTRYHCVTWDAAKQVILDTDPVFPIPVPVTNLQELGISAVEKAYRIVPCGDKKRKRRN